MIQQARNRVGTSAPEPEFHVVDERTANWLLRKLGNLEAEKRRVQEQAAKMVAALESTRSRLISLYSAELEAWARGELARQGDRKKTLHTYQATLAFRTVPAGVKVVDPEAALRYARENDGRFVVTVEKLDAAAYREEAGRLLSDTGELLPGVEAIPEHESFHWRFE